MQLYEVKMLPDGRGGSIRIIASRPEAARSPETPLTEIPMNTEPKFVYRFSPLPP